MKSQLFNLLANLSISVAFWTLILAALAFIDGGC